MRTWINFRTKLLIFISLFSIIPLLVIAAYVYWRVQTTYQKTMADSFADKSQVYEEVLVLFLDNYRSWLATLASQDVLIDAVDNTADRQKIFASLTSVRRENLYIERIYIASLSGEIVLSTASSDVGSFLENVPFLSMPLKERVPYIGQIISSPYQKRVIPVSAPILSKTKQEPVGVLIMELNTSLINALYEGKLLFKSQDPSDSQPVVYIADQEGFPLTKLKHSLATKTINSLPILNCRKGENSSGIWESYWKVNVLGVSRCLTFDGLVWTLVVEQPASQVFAVGRDLGFSLLVVSLAVAVLLSLLIIPASKTITGPLAKLSQGAKYLGSGNLDVRIQIATGDELENLADSFNDMAARLKDLVGDLKEEKEILQVQKSRLDQNAKLLLRRDIELHQTNDQMEIAKEHAEAERNKFEVVLGGIRDGVIAVDLERKIITLNSAAEQIIGFKSWEVVGKSIDQIFKIFYKGEEVSPEIFSPLRVDDYEGVVFSKQGLKLFGAGNKVTFVNLTAAKIKEGTTIKLGCILTFHDITSERQLERMKLDFVSMAAHELRTPLTTVQGYLSFLQESPTYSKLSSQEQEFLDRAIISSTTLNTLIENLLAVSKIEQGKMILAINKVDLENVIEKVVEEAKRLAVAKNLELIFKKPAHKLPPVAADQLRIEEVLSNLIGNAINYTQRGQVEISMSQKDNEISVWIADTGQGIPPEAIPHLFTKFFRVAGQLEAGSKGTGLGLYISKNIIEAHKGKIWVSRSQVGEGTTFVFSLPIA